MGREVLFPASRAPKDLLPLASTFQPFSVARADAADAAVANSHSTILFKMDATQYTLLSRRTSRMGAIVEQIHLVSTCSCAGSLASPTLGTSSCVTAHFIVWSR